MLNRGRILIGKETDCESVKCEFKPHRSPQDSMAERLGTRLQNLLAEFNSQYYLQRIENSNLIFLIKERKIYLLSETI